MTRVIDAGSFNAEQKESHNQKTGAIWDDEHVLRKKTRHVTQLVEPFRVFMDGLLCNIRKQQQARGEHTES
jgi:hypothetical protein